MKREEVGFAVSVLYLRRVSPLMVSMRTDARVPVPRNTCAHACVGRFLMRARARARRRCTRVHTDPAKAGRGGWWCAEDAHTSVHGRELCLARDVKLLAIS